MYWVVLFSAFVFFFTCMSCEFVMRWHVSFINSLMIDAFIWNILYRWFESRTPCLQGQRSVLVNWFFKWQYIKLRNYVLNMTFKLHSSVNVFWCAEQNPVCDDVPLENPQPASSNLICQQYFCKQNAQKWKWVYTYITWVHGNFLWFDSIS